MSNLVPLIASFLRAFQAKVNRRRKIALCHQYQITRSNNPPFENFQILPTHVFIEQQRQIFSTFGAKFLQIYWYNVSSDTIRHTDLHESNRKCLIWQ